MEWNSEMDTDEEITDDEDFVQLMLVVTFPRRKKVFRARPNPFQIYANQDFFDRFRLSKSTARFVLGLIETRISSATTR